MIPPGVRKLLRELATCSHDYAEEHRVSWCSICGAHRLHDGTWLLSVEAMYARQLLEGLIEGLPGRGGRLN